MKFLDLEPEFIQLTRTEEDCDKWGHHRVESLAQADGVRFLCPHHFREKGGSSGTHSVICYFHERSVPPQLRPGPGRWLARGDGLADLTLTPSVNLGDGDWHGHITNGVVSFA